MTPKEKAEELVEEFRLNVLDYEGCSINSHISKQCALITVERNVVIFYELINKMDDFSNESRQVIFQLIEDEEQIKKEIEKL